MTFTFWDIGGKVGGCDGDVVAIVVIHRNYTSETLVERVWSERGWGYSSKVYSNLRGCMVRIRRMYTLFGLFLFVILLRTNKCNERGKRN